MKNQAEYIPGTCNIGPVELKRRKNAMWFSLGLAIVTGTLLFVFDASKAWRLVLFLPVAAFAVNYQQVYYGFCVNFGLRGIFNFGVPGAHDTVEQAEFRKKDRNKAVRMIVTGTIIGLAAAVVVYCLPS